MLNRQLSIVNSKLFYIFAPQNGIFSFIMTLNVAGKLIDFTTPKVMGIINVTPDSFFADSRTIDPSIKDTSSFLLHRAESMIGQGAFILDIGACSTRPGSTPVSAEEELRRLDFALTTLAPLRERHPELLISIDTFRSDVARHCAIKYGIHIINDISAGQLDPAMFTTVADLHLPYVLTHYPQFSSSEPGVFSAESPILPSVARFFAEKLNSLYSFGIVDVILDPGFGFGKTLEQNYALLHHLGDLIRLFPSNTFLVGVSRKSMIYRLLGITPEEALNGTTVLNTIALQTGAHILRVHDVQPAMEAIKLCRSTLND